MAEGILFGLNANVLKRLGSDALRQISLAYGVHDELQKLKDSMSAIQAVLLDAEKQQTSNHRLRDWLGKLKDALYDIDDVLDEFQIEARRREIESTTRKHNLISALMTTRQHNLTFALMMTQHQPQPRRRRHSHGRRPKKHSVDHPRFCKSSSTQILPHFYVRNRE